MKKIISLQWFVVVLIGSILLAGCSSNTSSESGGNISLIASSGLSDQHVNFRGHFNPVMERVEEESGGQVSFTAYTSGELVPLGKELHALEQGTIDVALTHMTPYDSNIFPYSEIVLLPTLYSSVHVATAAFTNLMNSDVEIADGKTYYELEFGDKGLVAFANLPTEPFSIATTGHRFDDISSFNGNIQIRSNSRVHNILAKNLGLSSVSMPITEAYDALNRNALDGLLYNVADWKSTGFDELMKYTIVGTNLGHFAYHTVMLQETWDSLPSDIQEIYQTAQEEEIYFGADLTEEDSNGVKETNIGHGGEFVEFDDLSDPIKEHIEDAIVKTWFDWMDDLEGRGLAGVEMAKLWRDLLVEAGAELPQEILEIE